MPFLCRIVTAAALTIGLSTVANANEASASGDSKIEALGYARERVEGDAIVYCEANNYRVISEDCGKTEDGRWMCSIRYECASN